MTSRSNRRVALVVGAHLLLAATACGGDSERPGRPQITRPIDAGTFRDRACDLLPTADATRLGYPAEGHEDKSYRDGADTPFEYSCSRFPPTSLLLDINLYLNDDQLAWEYYVNQGAHIDSTGEPLLEPLTIADQPAVVLGRSHKQPEQSRSPCDVVVGLTDTQSLRTSASSRQPDGPKDNAGGRSCQLAIEVAEAIVRNLVK